MSRHRHPVLNRSLRQVRALSKDPRWIADVVLSALKRCDVTAAELRAIAEATAAAATPRVRVVERTPTGFVGDHDQVEPIDRKSAAAGDR